jgi:hypothetical protein
MSQGVARRMVVTFVIGLLGAACSSPREHTAVPESPSPEPVRETGAPPPGGASR